MKKPRAKKCSVCGRKVVGVCGYEFDHYMINNNVATVDEAIDKAVHSSMLMFDIHATRIKLGISANTVNLIARIRAHQEARLSSEGK